MPAHFTRDCWGSVSSTATVRPSATNSPARFAVMVLFPMPPFLPVTATIAKVFSVTVELLIKA